ncbi:putative amino acid/polyamine transport protein, partial [Globisporangium splendens]
MADTARDLQNAMPRETKARSGSDPGTPKRSAERRALEIAVPGGFRRHHVEQMQKPPVSRPLRDQIVDKIESVYNPFIGSILSQDNDKYDEMEVKERAESLLQTPVFKLPYRRVGSGKDLPAPSELSNLVTAEPSFSPRGESGKSTTLWHALLTLLKAFVGTGILFLPDGFRTGGIVFSPLCLTIVAALTVYAMLRLLQCRELVGGTYGHVGFEAYGAWGKRMVQISIILMQAGFCCTYVIFVAQNMQQVLAYLGTTVSTSALILLQIAVYIPLSWIRYISYFSISNLIADVFILYGLAIIFGNSFSRLATVGPQEVVYFNQQDYPVFIGTAIFTFEGIGLVLPTQSSLNKARQAKFPALLIATVIGLLFFYSFFAGVNYVAFGHDIQPMVTSSLPRNGWSISVQFGYSVAQLLSYPLFLFPAVKIMEEMMGFPKRASGQKIAKNCFRALAVVVTVSIAYFGQDRLDLFVSIVGAFCCVPLSFVYPPLFYLKLKPHTTVVEKIADSFVITLGALTFFYVTYSNLKKWSE